MLSVKRHFLLRKISKYLRKNLVVDPALSSASSARFPRDYLDIMRLNDDSCDDEFYADELCDDEFCDEVPSSTQFSDESPFCPQTESSAPSQKPRRHSASKGGKLRNIFSGSCNIDSIRSYVDSNYARLSFSQRLNLYMSEKAITTAMIYQRSFVDRKLISKIISSKDYHPSKQTVFALCIALRLNLKESTEFLSLAGYTFNHHKKYDLIIKFLLDDQVYEIDTVNEILFHFNEPCFGE